MSSNRLQVGIDFGQKAAHFGLFFPDGRPLDAHRAFDNSRTGFAAAKQVLLQALAQQPFDGLDISGEATSYYWLPFFLQLEADPDLARHDLNLFLLNPRWVRWFKKCFAPDDKSDVRDPFYIAERTRTHRPSNVWAPQWETVPLRFYTRWRFHLVYDLVREKSYASTLLFLKASAYGRLKPFADLFGVTSRQVLGEAPTLEARAALPVAALAQQLDDLSRHTLPDPLDNATKLQQVVAESFVLPPALLEPVQRLLDGTLAHLAHLEAQIARAEGWIATQVKLQPAIAQLDTIPGVGPTFSSGIGAEIGGVERFLAGTKWDPAHKRFRPKNLRDAEDAVAKMAGLWWPRGDSGDFEAEERRMAKSGNRYLRYYLIQAADKMRLHLPAYTAYYARKYKEVTKHQHKRALVLTARKSVGLFVGLLHRNEAFRQEDAEP
jgi:Transposase/Transposase IS116/IS110/IS902 family